MVPNMNQSICLKQARLSVCKVGCMLKSRAEFIPFYLFIFFHATFLFFVLYLLPSSIVESRSNYSFTFYMKKRRKPTYIIECNPFPFLPYPTSAILFDQIKHTGYLLKAYLFLHAYISIFKITNKSINVPVKNALGTRELRHLTLVATVLPPFVVA